MPDQGDQSNKLHEAPSDCARSCPGDGNWRGHASCHGARITRIPLASKESGRPRVHATRGGCRVEGTACSALPYSLSICGTVIICTCRYVYDWLRAPLGQVTGAERHPCSGSLPSQSAPLRCVASTRVGDSKTLSALTAPDSNPHQDVVYRRDG